MLVGVFLKEGQEKKALFCLPHARGGVSIVIARRFGVLLSFPYS